MKFVKVLLVIIMVLVLTACNSRESDAIKFKKEYEVLNGKKSENGKNTIKNLKISKNNPIKYATYDEVIDVIKKGTGIIYLGYPECPWCRSAIPVLLESAKDYKIDTIYYINMLKERDYYEVKDGKLVYKKDDDGKYMKGTKGYFKLLKALDSELDEYVIEDDDKKYDVKEVSQMISEYLWSLNERQQHLFIDRYYMLEPVEKTATELQISVQTAYRELAKIKQGLKKHLERNGVYV